MTTTATTSSTNTASANIVKALGAGSGIDLKALAQGLVDATRAPREDLINKSIDKSQARITGYSTVSYAIGQLAAAFDALKTRSSFEKFTVSNSQPGAVAFSAGPGAASGTHRIEVSQLAQAQRSVSAGMPKGKVLDLSDGLAIDLYLGDEVTPHTINLDKADASVQDIADAINAEDLDVMASVVDTGSSVNPMRLVLTGKTGESKQFSVSTSLGGAATSYANFGFDLDPVDNQFTPPGSASEEGDGAAFTAQLAQDARFTVDGVGVTRSSNEVSDVIPGAAFSLLSPTGSQPAVVGLSRDVSEAKTRIEAIVSAYNDLQSILDAASDKDSNVEKLGGTLVGDSTVRQLRDQIRRYLLPDLKADQADQASTDSSKPLVGLRQLGIFIDTDGKMKFGTLTSGAAPTLNKDDQTTLTNALNSRFDDVANLFTGTSAVLNGEDGLARDISDRLQGTGKYWDTEKYGYSPVKTLREQSATQQKHIESDKDRLSRLADEMSKLLQRYTQQFAAMDALVGESNSLKTSIENSFKGMNYSKN